MKKYLYNGVELPDINEVWTDKETYPYATIIHSTSNHYHLIVCGDRPSYTKQAQQAGEGVRFLKCFKEFHYADDSWVFSKENTDGGAFWRTEIMELVWTNMDVLNHDDGTIYFVATTPVPVPDEPDTDTTDYAILPTADYKAACDAIRAKTGKTNLIKSGDLAAEIADIETEPILQEKTVTENGVITADEGYDGLSKVAINVSIPDGYVIPNLQNKTFTENGEYVPDDGYHGFSRVTVDVPTYTTVATEEEAIDITTIPIKEGQVIVVTGE